MRILRLPALILALALLLPAAFSETEDCTHRPHLSEAAAAQLWLIELGYLDGPATGLADEATQAAVRAFQGERGLYRSGEVDSALLEALVRGDAPAWRAFDPALLGGGSGTVFSGDADRWVFAGAAASELLTADQPSQVFGDCEERTFAFFPVFIGLPAEAPLEAAGNDGGVILRLMGFAEWNPDPADTARPVSLEIRVGDTTGVISLPDAPAQGENGLPEGFAGDSLRFALLSEADMVLIERLVFSDGLGEAVECLAVYDDGTRRAMCMADASGRELPGGAVVRDCRAFVESWGAAGGFNAEDRFYAGELSPSLTAQILRSVGL